MNTSQSLPPSPPGRERSSRGYRAVWRWHFYAGLVTAPFALWLAVTGAIYLWKPQYEAARYRDLLQVGIIESPAFPDRPAAPLRVPPDTQFARALAARPDARPVTFTPSFAPGQTSETVLRLPDGDVASIFVHPHLGRVVGERRESERLMTTIHALHGELLAGLPGQVVMELAASWLFVLLLTGFFLWWPRPRFSVWGFLLPRLRARGRTFWRDLHAVPAVWASAGALFLLVTGIPWTTFAGGWYRQISTTLGEGTPRESSAGAHRSELTGWSPPLRQGLAGEIDALGSTPPPAPAFAPAVVAGQSPAAEPAAVLVDDAPPAGQVMIHDEQGNMLWVDRDDPRAPTPVVKRRRGPPDPASLEWCAVVLGPDAQHHPISLTRVMAIAAERNVPEPYAIALPAGEAGVFSVVSDRNQPFSRAYLHLNQYTGEVLADVRYQDFGLLAQFVLWGIIAHEGRLFGLANQILGTFAALGVFFLAISALLLWWRSRPAGGGFGTPARTGTLVLPRAVVIGVFALGALLPLLAASFTIFYVIDLLLARSSARAA